MDSAIGDSSQVDTYFQLGELAKLAGLISEADLNRILEAKPTGPRLGQMLIMSGLLTHEELQWTLQVQCLLRENLLDQKVAIKVLNMTRTQGIKLDNALQSLKVEDVALGANNRLGQLLVTAGTITEEELSDGLAMSSCTGLPLGRILSMSGILSEQNVDSLIVLQTMLRQGSIARKDAIDEIMSMAKERPSAGTTTPIEASPSPITPAKKITIVIEDLLVKAGLITQEVLVYSVHECVITCQQPEEVLIEHGYVDAEMVQAAAQVRDLLSAGAIELPAAIERLSTAYSQHLKAKESGIKQAHTGANENTAFTQAPAGKEAPVANGSSKANTELARPDALRLTGSTSSDSSSNPQSSPQTLSDFLVICNVITDEQRKRARLMRSGTALDEIGVLLKIHAVDSIDIEVAELCFQCLQDAILTMDHAIFAYTVFCSAVKSEQMTIGEISEALANPTEFKKFAAKLTKIYSKGSSAGSTTQSSTAP